MSRFISYNFVYQKIETCLISRNSMTHQHKTPISANKLLKKICGHALYEEFRGDLQEQFEAQSNAYGKLKARLWYWREVFVICWHFYNRKEANPQQLPGGPSFPLFGKHFKVALRRIWREKLYSAINISGLSVGLTCCLLLLIFVSNELNYDRFHQNRDNIYRLLVHSIDEEGESTAAAITAAIGPSMKGEFPEVVNCVRLSYPATGFFTNAKGSKIKTQNIHYADSTFFSIFSFSLLAGDPATALNRPNTVIITSTLAKKLFADEQQALGETITVNGKDILEITGIIEDSPANSQLQYSALISFSSLLNKGLFLDWNGGWNYYTYLQLQPQSDIDQLRQRFPPFMYKNINRELEEYGISWQLKLQPLAEVHLSDGIEGELATKGSWGTIIVFSSIAAVILLLACINFINLSTIQAHARSKEIGIRKVTGATKEHLVIQFFIESGVVTMLAFSLAFIIILLSRPLISHLFGNTLQLLVLSNIHIILLLIAALLAITLAAAIYPAFYLSSLKPTLAIKGKGVKKAGTHSLGSALLVFQFVISIVLIASTLIVYHQMSFIRQKNLGFNKENILVINLQSKDSRQGVETLKTELRSIGGVIRLGASSEVPGNGFTSNGYLPQGLQNPIMIHALDIDSDFLSTLDIDIVEGRNFDPARITDKDAILINETLADRLGWEDPIGKYIERNGKHEVIGVVRNFNYATLHQQIEPLLFTQKPWRGFSLLSIRVNATNIPSTLSQIEARWKDIHPNEPIDYYFLDHSYNEVYKKERQQGQLFMAFSAIAIIIACLGLFGLVSYSLNQKIKEIGVRKVLGAGNGNLLIILNKSYLTKVIIAVVVGSPIAYAAATRWVRSFHYHADISPQLLMLSVAIVFSFALLAINLQTLKAVNRNPAETLKEY